MSERHFAVSDPNFMDCKKSALWIMEGNTMTKLATFTNEQAKKDFLNLLEEKYQGHVVNGL